MCEENIKSTRHPPPLLLGELQLRHCAVYELCFIKFKMYVDIPTNLNSGVSGLISICLINKIHLLFTFLKNIFIISVLTIVLSKFLLKKCKFMKTKIKIYVVNQHKPVPIQTNDQI